MDPVTGLKTLKRKGVVRGSHYGKKSGLCYGICLDFDAKSTKATMSIISIDLKDGGQSLFLSKP